MTTETAYHHVLDLRDHHQRWLSEELRTAEFAGLIANRLRALPPVETTATQELYEALRERDRAIGHLSGILDETTAAANELRDILTVLPGLADLQIDGKGYCQVILLAPKGDCD